MPKCEGQITCHGACTNNWYGHRKCLVYGFSRNIVHGLNYYASFCEEVSSNCYVPPWVAGDPGQFWCDKNIEPRADAAVDGQPQTWSLRLEHDQECCVNRTLVASRCLQYDGDRCLLHNGCPEFTLPPYPPPPPSRARAPAPELPPERPPPVPWPPAPVPSPPPWWHMPRPSPSPPRSVHEAELYDRYLRSLPRFPPWPPPGVGVETIAPLPPMSASVPNMVDFGPEFFTPADASAATWATEFNTLNTQQSLALGVSLGLGLALLPVALLCYLAYRCSVQAPVVARLKAWGGAARSLVPWTTRLQRGSMHARRAAYPSGRDRLRQHTRLRNDDVDAMELNDGVQVEDQLEDQVEDQL